MINNMGGFITEMQKIQEELKNLTVEISEGGGAFRIVINGYQEVLDVKFDPLALNPENIENLQNIVTAAFNRAITDSKQLLRNEIGKMTGGLNLPNITGLF